MASGVYKAIHGYKVPRGIGELLHERSTNYNLRGKHILKLPQVNTTTYGCKSWRYIAAKIWYALPDHFRSANNIGTFFFFVERSQGIPRCYLFSHNKNEQQVRAEANVYQFNPILK